MFEVRVRVNDILYDMKAVQYELSSFLVIAYVGQGGIESAGVFQSVQGCYIIRATTLSHFAS